MSSRASASERGDPVDNERLIIHRRLSFTGLPRRSLTLTPRNDSAVHGIAPDIRAGQARPSASQRHTICHRNYNSSTNLLLRRIK